ncbi:MAG: flagellar biosynthesis anti-sigma factor FlgM [Solirubrobacterales bacterium]|jgi:hypothetical protein
MNRPAPPSSGLDKVTQLKEQIATRTYRVDAQAVAREMLFKMRMMALLRGVEDHRRSWSNPDGSRGDPSA